MCSIIASKSKEVLTNLVQINQHRGNFSFSITSFSINPILELTQIKQFGEFNPSKLTNLHSEYYATHVQAPTGGLIKDSNRIHPTKINNSLLWHNGIITNKGIRYLQEKLNTDIEFDTELLHMFLDTYGFSSLSDIEGLFSCLYYKDSEFFIFRTKHGKLYIDDDLNISSERFENSKCINYDTIYNLNFGSNQLENIDSFRTKRYNYIIEGEING